jgi:hypothetical protein
MARIALDHVAKSYGGGMTGATGVHLLLWDEYRQDWLLPAPGGGTVPASDTGQRGAVPMSVLRYVQRTCEPLVVCDAISDDRFSRDPYLTTGKRTWQRTLPTPWRPWGTWRSSGGTWTPQRPATRRAFD